MNDDSKRQEDINNGEEIPVAGNRRGPKRKFKEDTKAKIVELAIKNVPTKDIAAVVGCSKTTVNDTLKAFAKVFKTLPDVQKYRSVKSDLLAAGQLIALESAISPAKVKKATALQSAQMFEIFNKAERLDSGQSSENISVKVFGAIKIDQE